jgi:hypothetical protein
MILAELIVPDGLADGMKYVAGTIFEITSWNSVLLEKPPVAQLLKNFLPFYGTRRFITVLTRALHWSPS